MNKKTALLLLPDYVQGRLAPEIRQQLYAMITADPALARECTELKQYFADMHGLPQEKAPVGFAARVLRRINTPQEKAPLISWLFKPFHIKLPIETFAVVATVVVAVVIFYPRYDSTLPISEDKKVVLSDTIMEKEKYAPPLLKSNAEFEQKSERKMMREEREMPRSMPKSGALADAGTSYQWVLALTNVAIYNNEIMSDKKMLRSRQPAQEVSKAEEAAPAMEPANTNPRSIEQIIVSFGGKIAQTEHDLPEYGNVRYSLDISTANLGKLENALGGLGKLHKMSQSASEVVKSVRIVLVVK